MEWGHNQGAFPAFVPHAMEMATADPSTLLKGRTVDRWMGIEQDVKWKMEEVMSRRGSHRVENDGRKEHPCNQYGKLRTGDTRTYLCQPSALPCFCSWHSPPFHFISCSLLLSVGYFLSEHISHGGGGRNNAHCCRFVCVGEYFTWFCLAFSIFEECVCCGVQYVGGVCCWIRWQITSPENYKLSVEFTCTAVT